MNIIWTVNNKKQKSRWQGFQILYRRRLISENTKWNTKSSRPSRSSLEGSATFYCVYYRFCIKWNMEIWQLLNPCKRCCRHSDTVGYWTLSLWGCIQDRDKTKSSCFGLNQGSEVWKVLNAAHKQKLLLSWLVCMCWEIFIFYWHRLPECNLGFWLGL